MAAPTADEPDARSPAVEELRARIELLEAENRALRDARARRRQTRYRRTAAGLGAVGLVAAVAAVALPDAREVLFALAGTGVFAGLLTYYLTPERFITADVGEAAYEAYAATLEAVVDELGLADHRVYVPRGSEAEPVRLFLPQHTDYAIPESLDSVFVVADDEGRRGVSLEPTGVPLFRDLEATLSGPLADAPGPLADQLADGVVEGFELAERATPDVDAERGRVTVAVEGCAFGAPDRIDHPIASLLAVGLAVGMDRPIVAEAARAADGPAEFLVTCRWSTPGP